MEIFRPSSLSTSPRAIVFCQPFALRVRRRRVPNVRDVAISTVFGAGAVENAVRRSVSIEPFFPAWRIRPSIQGDSHDVIIFFIYILILLLYKKSRVFVSKLSGVVQKCQERQDIFRTAIFAEKKFGAEKPELQFFSTSNSAKTALFLFYIQFAYPYYNYCFLFLLWITVTRPSVWKKSRIRTLRASIPWKEIFFTHCKYLQPCKPTFLQFLLYLH